MKTSNTYAIFIAFFLFTACQTNSSNMNTSSADSTQNDSSSKTELIPPAKNFQATIDGKRTDLYTLKNGNMQVAIT
ncbi:MAG TPA: hypothetical protein VEV83_05940, partial [Parafilimonas sp.]|nr:hypothetical protein [Parafilimonas sp.]